MVWQTVKVLEINDALRSVYTIERQTSLNLSRYFFSLSGWYAEVCSFIPGVHVHTSKVFVHKLPLFNSNIHF